MTVEDQLRSLLLPVFALDSADAIRMDQSLVQDLGAESLDIVEIVFSIEKTFGVHLETKDLITGGAAEEELFAEGRLTAGGLERIAAHLPDGANRFSAGMTKMDIFQKITVGDLAHIIRTRTEG